MSPSAEQVIRTTCPRDCYDSCGIEVAVRDGRIRHVRGDRSHPVARGKLCKKCAAAYNNVLLDPQARLLHPLRRSGAKGAGEFTQVSWEQALAEIASRLREIPGHKVLNTHYTGTFALLGYNFPLRFFARLGATEVDPDTICNNAGHVALGYLFGTSEDGFDPRSASDAAAIMVWGANPSAAGPHQHEHWLAEAPGTVIVVDPIRTPTAEQADLHLQPFPGADAALAFSLAHVIAREGLLDRDFIAAATVGFDELEPTLSACTPEWGERVTGVPAALIERAATVYGAGPSLLWLGQGFQRQRRGGNAMRAVAQLAALSGNIGRPGTGFLYLNGAASRRLDDDYVTALDGVAEPPEPISHMRLAEYLEDPGRSSALFCWNMNIAASSPEQARLRAALAREDLFTVAIELFATDTVDYADVVLPAASFLESDDVVVPYFHLALAAQRKATEPLGESLPNTEIFRRLAGAMGYEEPGLYESDAEVIARALAPTGLSFEELAASGTVWLEEQPVIPFAELRFPTPSGKVELASEAAQRDGHPRTAQPHADPRPREGRLRLLSPASPWMMNHSFANERKLAGRAGPAAVALHPEDAAARGLVDGGRALLKSAAGQLELAVRLDRTLPRGVAYSPKGHWPKREPTRANVNVLNPGGESDMGASTTVHGVEVTITPA